ncbi:MAG: DMP19 family protein [Pirellulales bacterium]|nr:DMP19 family protein [Pirellulales bacterium]
MNCFNKGASMGDILNVNSWLIRLSEVGRFWQMDYEQLTRPEQVFFGVWELEAEVNNGGFDQYFYNSSGDHAFAIVDVLNEINAHQAAAIVRQAISVFNGGMFSRESAKRQEQLLALSEDAEEEFDSLDEEFFEYPDNLTELLYAYVRQHQSEIAGVDKVDREFGITL